MDQRPFRFRLPWPLAPTPAPSSTPTTVPQPTAEPEAPRQPRGAATRPPFRPAGVAQPSRPSAQPPQPPPQSKAESSQPLPPPRTKATSPPAPPPKIPNTTEPQVAPQPPAPPPKTPQIRAESSKPSTAPSRTKATSPPAPPQKFPKTGTDSSKPSPAPSRSKATSPPTPPQKMPKTGAETNQSPPAPSRTKVTSPPAPPPKTPKTGTEPHTTPQPPPSPAITQASTLLPPKSDPPSPSSIATQVPKSPSPVTKPPPTSISTETPSPSKHPSTGTQLLSPSKAATLSQLDKPEAIPSSPSQLNSLAKPTTSKNSPASPSQQKSTNLIITSAWEKLMQQEPKKPVNTEKVIGESQTIADSTTKPQSMPTIPGKAEHVQIQKPAPATTSPPQRSFPGTPMRLNEQKSLARSPEEGKTNREEMDNGVSNNHSKQQEITETPPPPLVSSAKTSPAKKPNNAPQAFARPEIFQTKDILTASDTHPSLLHNPTPAVSKSNRNNPHNPTMSGGDKSLPLHRDINDNISKIVSKLGIGGQGKKHLPLSLNGENKPVSVITLAGENRGASMTLGGDPTGRRERSIHIHRGYRTNPDESPDTTTDGEESSRLHNNNSRSKVDDVEKNESYINSNVQGINNSLVFNSSVSERNPGVQYTISCNQPRETRGTRNDPGRYEASKAESSVTSAKKLAYTPTIRRRCLRGLFMESSDSDPENPDKPRRHGCRYEGCTEKTKDNRNINVL